MLTKNAIFFVKHNAHTCVFSLKIEYGSTVPPSVVVHEPAPHAGLRTDCEYIE